MVSVSQQKVVFTQDSGIYDSVAWVFQPTARDPDDRIPNQRFHFGLGGRYNDKWTGHHTRPPRLELRNNSASHRPIACTVLKHVDNIQLIQQGLEWNLACTIDKRGPFNQ